MYFNAFVQSVINMTAFVMYGYVLVIEEDDENDEEDKTLQKIKAFVCDHKVQKQIHIKPVDFEHTGAHIGKKPVNLVVGVEVQFMGFHYTGAMLFNPAPVDQQINDILIKLGKELALGSPRFLIYGSSEK